MWNGNATEQGMCHRDLKLENLLLSGNPPKLKICDFGYVPAYNQPSHLSRSRSAGVPQRG